LGGIFLPSPPKFVELFLSHVRIRLSP
jgi:hypothetical protein